MGLYRTGQFLPTYVGRIERAIARTTPARVFQAEFARSFYRTAERRTRLLGQARLAAIDLYSFRRDAMEYALQASSIPTSADVEELAEIDRFWEAENALVRNDASNLIQMTQGESTEIRFDPHGNLLPRGHDTWAVERMQAGESL